MDQYPLDLSSRVLTENRLINRELGFSAAYMAVKYIRQHIEAQPESISPQTGRALLALAASDRFESKKQVLFLYQEAFDALVRIAVTGCSPESGLIIPKLNEMLAACRGKRTRALAQALGNLPVRARAVTCADLGEERPASIRFHDLAFRMGIPDGADGKWKGRSLVFSGADQARTTLKFAHSDANVREIYREGMWLRHLKADSLGTDLPVPLCSDGQVLFRVLGLPAHLIPDCGELHGRPAIVYNASAAYYAYPNTPVAAQTLPQGRILDIFRNCAKSLGRLMSQGLVHTALIPLFHNRIQQGRRQDRGVYLWEHGGRLDQWLESCRYPNFAASGIRDLEHLEPLDRLRGRNGMRHYIGDHMLSFILVMGSYFRNKAPHTRGWDENGLPLDTRKLFDADFFRELLTETISGYCRGFNGRVPGEVQGLDLAGLVDGLIQKMGLDEDMEETLRANDQAEMDSEGFVRFLAERGVTGIRPHRRGRADISLMTGPHLGRFNSPISVPALIEFLFRFSALCVSDRYLMENGLKA